MQKGYWAIVTYEAGNIGEKVKYWTTGEQPPRSERKRKADLRKQRQNDKNTARVINRILNANWPSSRGHMIALTYDADGISALGLQCEYDKNDPEQWEAAFCAADHQLDLFLRRFRRACQKAGKDCRYFAMTSDLEEDKKLGEMVHARAHHHIVIDSGLVEIAKRCWHFGEARDRQLTAEPDHYDLAEYFVKQMRRVRENAARYTTSRNLNKPKESMPRIAKTGKEVQPPKGAFMLFRAPYEPGRPQYIRYVIKQPEDEEERQ